MKKTNLSVAIAALVLSSSAFAAPTPDAGIVNTISGVSGSESAVMSTNVGASVDNTASIGSASAGAGIIGGIGNSIGISAVGSSASVSTSTVTNAPNNNVSNDLAVGNIDSYNSAVITNGKAEVGANTITGGEISGGISNSVSISSIGSSASLSSRTTMETMDPASVNNGNSVTNTVGGTKELGITVTSTNEGNVNNVGAIQGVNVTQADGTTTTIAPSISGESISASIGISAVGSSASESSSTTVSGGISSPVSNFVNVSSLDSLNTGAISNVGNIDGGTISGGIGNSVSVSGIGSAASMSNSVILH